jgi:hypothetical protein
VTTQLKSSVSDYDREESRLEQCKVVTDAQIYADKIKKAIVLQGQIKPIISALEGGIVRYKVVLTDLTYSDILLKADKMIGKLNRFIGIRDEAKVAVSELGGCIKKYTSTFDEYSTAKRGLGVAQRELALVPNCPICGAVRKHEEVIF